MARLMREQGLRARTKRRLQRTTDPQHGLPIAANVLDRQFTVATPNTAWVSDIRYLWTREGWLYLVVLLDLFSRRVIGWAPTNFWALRRHLARRGVSRFVSFTYRPRIDYQTLAARLGTFIDALCERVGVPEVDVERSRSAAAAVT